MESRKDLGRWGGEKREGDKNKSPRFYRTTGRFESAEFGSRYREVQVADI